MTLDFSFDVSVYIKYLTKMRISFQGAKGAYSDQACKELYKNAETIGYTSFDDAFNALKSSETDLAVIPIDNTLAGRVADVHHLLPKSELYIIGEHFLPIRHCLMAVKGATLNNITHVYSHIHALPQCRDFIKKHHFETVVHADTAGAAADIAKMNDKAQAAIASSLAAEIYDLDILDDGIQDDASNKTRFIVLSRDDQSADTDKKLMTSFIFQVRDIPAALYKAMGGFATNGINMMKLESYVDHQFYAARFYCEVSSDKHSTAFQNAIEELGFFADNIQILGCYPQSPLRQNF
jgi:prephenate dehydratase